MRKSATNQLRDLTGGGARCDCYKRSVCTVRTRDGQNVATLMLAAGLGCIDERFEHEARDTDRHAAQDTRRCMWSQPDPMCAADYRRATR
jgi:endonuclease YncB( thermonuclease family)